jgi:predicted TIM-barrel fold metal-dependent hydrolase
MTDPDRFRARISPQDVIDMHVHLVAMDPRQGHFLSPKVRRGVMFHFLRRVLGLKGETDGDLEEDYWQILARSMGEEGAPDKAVLLALDGVYDEHGEPDVANNHMVISNEAVFALCEAHPRFLPAASVNPMRADAMEALEAVAAQGAVMLKFLPNLQNFDPEEERFRPFWRRCAALGLPLLFHTGYEHALPSLNEDWGDPLRLIPALEEGCTVIAAHCAAAGRFHRYEYFNHFVSLLPRYPRLYGDISGFASPIRASYLEPMLAIKARRRRVLVGSDFPIPCVVEPFVGKLGMRRTVALRLDGNPLRRNRDLFEALGMDAPIMTRAARVLLGQDEAPVLAPEPGRRRLVERP